MIIPRYIKYVRRINRFFAFITAITVTITAIIKVIELSKSANDLYRNLPEEVMYQAINLSWHTIKCLFVCVIFYHTLCNIAHSNNIRKTPPIPAESVFIAFIPAILFMISSAFSSPNSLIAYAYAALGFAISCFIWPFCKAKILDYAARNSVDNSTEQAPQWLR